jgi:monoterpene epsilon-lactone hydrolase
VQTAVDRKDPRVSPIYADLSKGFSPSLIVDGTRCLLLSQSVRFYNALGVAGQETTLDIYEGMWHVFQQFPLPESEVSIRKSAAFINWRLNK